MTNTIRALISTEVVQETATVVRRDQESWFVQSGAGLYQAKRAVSCLVEPLEGDTVLVASSKAGTCYVLAVLERDQEVATRIAVEGDLELQVPDGRFSVAASDGIGLVSKSQVSVVSAEVKVNAVEANVALQKATLVGKYLQTEFERIKSFATSFDGIFERFSQRAKNSYRRVEGLDQVKAENVDYNAKKTMNLHGENAVMTARQLVKVDGEQIHMG